MTLKDYDRQTKTEVYHSVYLAAHAAFKEMFEQDILSRHQYSVLHDSCTFGAEAAEGDLSNYAWLERSPLEAVHGLGKKDPDVQIDNSMDVALTYVLFCCRFERLENRLENFKKGLRNLYKLGIHSNPETKYYLIQDNLHILIAYVVVYEDLLSELPAVFQFPSLARRMISLMRIAKYEWLDKLCSKYPGPTLLMEHVLFATLSVTCKRLRMKELAREGVMRPEDVDDVLEEYVDPYIDYLKHFHPNRRYVRTLMGNVRRTMQEAPGGEQDAVKHAVMEAKPETASI